MKQQTKTGTYQKGIWAERYAAAFLVLKGYRILKTRYKTKVGEVDLIARRGNTIVFVEVKAHGTYIKGVEAISPTAKGRISRAAQLFTASHPKWSGQTVRFDVMIVHRSFIITHITNAWNQHDTPYNS